MQNVFQRLNILKIKRKKIKSQSNRLYVVHELLLGDIVIVLPSGALPNFGLGPILD